MPLPHFPSGNPDQSWTFREIINWINSIEPGQGQKFINWVRTHNDVPPPYKLNLNSRTFGPGGFGLTNTAYSWFSVWLAQDVIGPKLGKVISKGITSGGKDIPKELQGAGEGIGAAGGSLLQNPLAALGQFLTQRSLWVRIAEGVIGTAFIIVAVAKLGGSSQAGKAATKVGKAVKIL